MIHLKTAKTLGLSIPASTGVDRDSTAKQVRMDYFPFGLRGSTVSGRQTKLVARLRCLFATRPGGNV